VVLGNATQRDRVKGTIMVKKTVRSIDEDTGIIPAAAAETVVEKAARLTGMDSVTDREIGFYVGRLVETAETLYRTNLAFRKKLQASGNKGRDHLYAFMQHWISSMFLKDSGNDQKVRRALIDSGFSMGRDL
jgi:hypothetical protein